MYRHMDKQAHRRTGTQAHRHSILGLGLLALSAPIIPKLVDSAAFQLTSLVDFVQVFAVAKVMAPGNFVAHFKCF